MRRGRLPSSSLLAFVLALPLATPAIAHEDDPKVLDRRPAFAGSGWRAAQAAAGDGSAAAVQFQAKDVTLLSWLSLAELGGAASGNDCWGYVSPSGREYALVGTSSATVFVEVTSPTDPTVVAVRPGPQSLWRDVKVYQHHAYSVSEGGGGIQVFDLSQIDAGAVSLVNTVTSGGTSATHNVAIDPDGGFLYRCGGGDHGLRIYSLADPASPVLAGQWNDRYVHDAAVRTYESGPWAGRRIAFCSSGFNGGFTQTGLSILEVTDPSNVVHLGQIAYPGAKYSHQCWPSEDGTLVYLNDELDEDGSFPTTTYVIDVSDLANPVYSGSFTNGNQAVGHNLYVRGDRIYEANYRSGLRVFDASDPLAPVEIAWFDTFPSDDSPSFNGLWSNYPFLPSGVVVGSDMEKGLFVWWVGEPLVSFSFPDGLPAAVDPDGGTLLVHLAEAEPGALVPGSARIHVDWGEGSTSADLVPLGGGDHLAQLPAVPCGTELSFHFSAESAGGIDWVDPPSGAPPYTAVAAEGLSTILADDLEGAAAGWVSGVPGDTATTGHWTLGDPIGTAAQPEDDHTPGGSICWFTGQGSPGGSLGQADVDGGATTLLSPVLDLSGVVEPRVSYWRWYSNSTGASPESDVLQVDVTNDGGATWAPVETVGPSGPEVHGGWFRHSFRVADFVAPTSDVRLRFVASDFGAGSIVEAAIDDLEVVSADCPDCDGDLASDPLAIASGDVLDLDGDGTPDVCQPLSADGGELSLSAGGTVGFVLDAGTGHALAWHLLLGTTSGTEPGTPYGGVLVPLNVDSYTGFTLSSPNTPPLAGTFGSFDGQGGSTAAISIPPGTSPSLAGLLLHHAFVVVDPASGVVPFASNALPLSLLP